MNTPSTQDFSTRRTVAGLFRTRSEAEQAIHMLKHVGFEDQQIGVAMRGHEETESFAQDTGTLAGPGAASGAVSGGVVGGVIGLLVGVGALAIPGVGPVIAGGVLGATLTGASIGAVSGGLIGALIGLGIPEEEASHFETGVREGSILVTVSAEGRGHEAAAVLRQAGADFGPGGGPPMGPQHAVADTGLTHPTLDRGVPGGDVPPRIGAMSPGGNMGTYGGSGSLGSTPGEMGPTGTMITRPDMSDPRVEVTDRSGEPTAGDLRMPEGDSTSLRSEQLEGMGMHVSDNNDVDQPGFDRSNSNVSSPSVAAVSGVGAMPYSVPNDNEEDESLLAPGDVQPSDRPRQ